MRLILLCCSLLSGLAAETVRSKTASVTLRYVWNGTVPDYSDSSLGTIGAGEAISWKEWTCVYTGPPTRNLAQVCR